MDASSAPGRLSSRLFFLFGSRLCLCLCRKVIRPFSDLGLRNAQFPQSLVPVVGTVACGSPILAEENIEEYVTLPAALFGRGNFFLLRARGDSMINAGIADGDLVLVRQQDTAEYNQIAVALIDDEATLKRFRPEGDRVVLHAENPNYDDIVVDRCAVQGVAVKVIKDLL